MIRTLVLQSAPEAWLSGWVALCLRSVQKWSTSRGYVYRFLDDAELFAQLPESYAAKVAGRGPILADLGRLQAAQRALDANEADEIFWFDADVLLWGSPEFDFDDELFGRERWVFRDDRGRLRVHTSVHNALAGFRRGGVVLPYLLRVTQRIIESADAGHIAPQMVGPKLLTALNSLSGFQVTGQVGALSPAVQEDLLAGGGEALDRLLAVSEAPLEGANLCASLALPERARLCERLLEKGLG